MEYHALKSLIAAATPYVEFLRKGDMSAGLYRLAVGVEDRQQPHTEDEVYFVASGRARFWANGQDIPVATGDILFVPAAEPHRFHSIVEELQVLVFFAPAEGSRR